MKKIGGDIGLMPLPDLLQWAELSKKSGTLSITYKGVDKSFYLHDGAMVFVSSTKEGERPGDFFQATGNLQPSQIASALKESKRLGIPFTLYLIDTGLIGQKTLEQAYQSLAEKVLSDALIWEGGSFEFSDGLPPLISKGPVMLNISFVVFNSVKMLDEVRRNAPPETLGIADALKQIAKQIIEGYTDIPLVSDIILRLNEAVARDSVPLGDIARIISADQVLTSRILKVVNSALYGSPDEITSLEQAIIFAGQKTVLSIATLHAIESINPVDAGEVKAVLRHSLGCAFMASRMAPVLQLDKEDAFACGLLHDIGKTLILDFIHGKTMEEKVKQELLSQYHSSVGFILANKWKFSELIKDAIRCHHSPSDVVANREMVKLICAADLISYTGDLMGVRDACGDFDVEKIAGIVDDLETIKALVETII